MPQSLRAGWASAASLDARAIEIDYAGGTMKAADRVLRRGEFITLDGSTGEVIAGRVPTVRARDVGFLPQFHEMGRQERRLGVRANADTPQRRPCRDANSAPKASVCAALSICFSDLSGSMQYAR